MSPQIIRTWSDGYLELRRRIMADRGAVALSDGTRWPRASGEQVAAIAAVFTPALLSNAAPNVLRRWRGIIADIQQEALPRLCCVYRHNRSFWATLEACALHLDDLALCPPAQGAWVTLFALLRAGTPRNVGPSSDGPFKHFDGVQTFDDLYNAQFIYLRDLRGFDRMKPDGDATGVERPIPRTTNADVRALADYWTEQLAGVKHVMGGDHVVDTWNAVIAEVDQLAHHGDPSAVYLKNNAFWRALQQTAIHIAVADEAPSKWDLAKESLKDSAKRLPDTVRTVADEAAHVIEKATGAAVDFVGDVAHAGGHIVNQAAKGVLGGVGTPLLIGAGVLGAVFLFRGGHRHEEA